MNHSNFDDARHDSEIDDRGASVQCDGQRLDLSDAPLPSWMLKTDPKEMHSSYQLPIASGTLPGRAQQGMRRSSLMPSPTNFKRRHSNPGLAGVPPLSRDGLY